MPRKDGAKPLDDRMFFDEHGTELTHVQQALVRAVKSGMRNQP